MIETKIPSTNGKDSLHVVIWEPVSEIKAIVQISHGMVEYVKRYDEFARYLNTYGFLVIGNMIWRRDSPPGMKKVIFI